MIRCAKCVLPKTFPNISFDEQGVCNFCRAHKEAGAVIEEKKQYLEKFKDLIKKTSGRGDYDCTVSYSGGKDSSYTIYVLKRIFKLKVLALVMDNGFLSPQAFKNVNTISENLEVDVQIFRPDFNLMKKIFSYAAKNEMYSAKTLERASTICTSCIGLVKFIFLKAVLEKKIPLMAWGWSPGQAPIRSSIMKINPKLFRHTQEQLRAPMSKAAGEEINRYFLSDDDFKNVDAFPYNVSPLAFMEYDEKKIKDKIKELGWVAPEDVDSNSTNCLLNSFSNKIHMDRYGFHPYAFEIAEMVRTGVMDREEGLKKIENIGVDETIEYAKKKLKIN